MYYRYQGVKFPLTLLAGRPLCVGVLLSTRAQQVADVNFFLQAKKIIYDILDPGTKPVYETSCSGTKIAWRATSELKLERSS
jgi:hypothetical protein